MQLVISDSSTLIHLSAVNRFGLIREYFSSMHIPRAVYQEVVLCGKRRPGSEEVIQAIHKGIITVHDVKNTPLIISLCHQIHRGEAEVIALALECNYPLLLLDDHDARHEAERFGLSYTGIIGILIKARIDKKIPSLKIELEQLRTVGRFWISDHVMQKALIAAGEG